MLVINVDYMQSPHQSMNESAQLECFDSKKERLPLIRRQAQHWTKVSMQTTFV